MEDFNLILYYLHFSQKTYDSFDIKIKMQHLYLKVFLVLQLPKIHQAVNQKFSHDKNHLLYSRQLCCKKIGKNLYIISRIFHHLLLQGFQYQIQVFTIYYLLFLIIHVHMDIFPRQMSCRTMVQATLYYPTDFLTALNILLYYLLDRD